MSDQSEDRDERDSHHPRGVTRRWCPGAICCGLYVALAMIAFGRIGSLGSGHMVGTGSVDAIEQVWWLAWTAFAVPHGHDVFLAQWQNYPAGENFGVQGSMLALGILFLPITKVFGPIVAWNIALRLALAVSAASMCFVLRRWVTWWPAAFVGGLLYGFSAYALTFVNSYLFLTFVPLPPVFFLLLHEILVRQRWRPSRVGAVLGVVCCLQFFIWSEVLAGMVLVGVMATGLFLVVNRHRLEKTWRYAVRAFAFSGVVGGGLLLLPGAFTLFGPQNTQGSPTTASSRNLLPSDLLGPIVPATEWLSTKGTTALAAHFPYAIAEYMGIPMIVVLVCFAVLFRKRRIILFAGAMALITFILSLGSRLWIDGHETPLPLPWAIFGHLPVISGYTPVRFCLYTSLFSAAMFAIGLDEVRRRLRGAKRPKISSPSRRTLAASGSLAIAAAVVLPLVPANAQPSVQSNIPSYFMSTAVDAIPEGSVVLAYPYPDIGPQPYNQPTYGIMLYQAASGMRFKLLGGYGWFPSPTGRNGTPHSLALHPRSVEAHFDNAYWGAPWQSALLSPATASSDLRTLLRRYDVDAVVLQPQGKAPAAVVRYVTGAIGCPVYYPDLAVWLHVKQRVTEGFRGRDVSTCASPPDATPRPVVFAKGSTVSGTTILAAGTSVFLRTTHVAYYLSGGPFHEKQIASGSTPGGSIALWNTRTVPNGRYVMRTVAVYGAGLSSTSSGTAITVRN